MTRTLVLIPTKMEFDSCAPRLLASSIGDRVTCEICGFGPIAAAASTARLIADQQPLSLLVLGIAGSYHNDLAIGHAYQFGTVACDGIGAGEGEHFQSAESLGWLQLPATNEQQPIGDKIELQSGTTGSDSNGHQLLTVCSSAGNPAEVRRRLARWPSAVAEDMEGFAVAMAGKQANCPTTVIRGISNRAGNREHATWQIATALAAATELAIQWIASRP